MRLILAALFLIAGSVAMAAPVWANNSCHDLWFTRNLIIDRAGYCFGSPLGQAVFDNSDCSGGDVTLDPVAKQMVAHIRALEAEFGCAVDTSQTTLELDDAALRRRLADLPVVDQLGSGCIGWLGPETHLYAALGPDAARVGQIEPGDWILFEHFGDETGSYVTAREPETWRFKSGGWLRSGDMRSESCAQWAG